MKNRTCPVARSTNKPRKRIELIAIAIIATLLTDGTCDSHAQVAALIAQQAYLKASNTGALDDFGAVAVSGDTMVVGAPGESSNATGVNADQSDNSAPESGAVYVFTGLGPSAPQIDIARSAGSVRIFWPLSAGNFVLDETDDLNTAPTNDWVQIPFPYQTNAAHVSTTLPLPAGNKFYRLRKP